MKMKKTSKEKNCKSCTSFPDSISSFQIVMESEIELDGGFDSAQHELTAIQASSPSPDPEKSAAFIRSLLKSFEGFLHFDDRSLYRRGFENETPSIKNIIEFFPTELMQLVLEHHDHAGGPVEEVLSFFLSCIIQPSL